MSNRFKISFEENKEKKIKNNLFSRKLLLDEQIELFNNKKISTEGFFDFLFGKKKEVKVKDKTIDDLIELVDNNESIKIKTESKDFNEYINILEDLEENVFVFYDKNIDRVTKFLNLFLQHKENISDFKKESEKLGKLEISIVKIKDDSFYKSKFHSAHVLSYNSNDHLYDSDIELTSKQKGIMEFPVYLEDIDFPFIVNVNTSEEKVIILDETQRKKLSDVLNKLKNKLIHLKPNALKLRDLFSKTEDTYIQVLKNLNFPSDFIEDDYVGFGGSMYQGLGYIYEIERGIESDLSKEITL